MVDVGSIGQSHLAGGAPRLVLAERLERDFLPEDKLRGGVLSVVAICLAFLLTVDALESETFGVFVVQDFEGVAFEDGDDGAEEIFQDSGTGEQEGEEAAQTVTMTLQASRPCEPLREGRYQRF